MPSCPSCGKGVTAATAKCPSCGSAIAAPTAPAGGHSYDLMPEEPKKKEEGGTPVVTTAFDAAISEQAAAKPGEIIRPKISLRPDDDGPQQPFFTKGTAAIAALAGILLIGVVFKACKTEYKLEGAYRRPSVSDVDVPAQRPKIENFVVKGGASYEFEVTATGGDLLFGVVKRDPKSSATIQSVKSAPEGLTAVPKGSTQKLEGNLKAGTYSWVVVNEGPKAVKAKWKYLAAIPK